MLATFYKIDHVWVAELVSEPACVGVGPTKTEAVYDLLAAFHALHGEWVLPDQVEDVDEV